MHIRGSVLLVLSALLVPTPAAAAARQPDTPSAAHHVTLLTGDVVTFTDDATVVVEPVERPDHQPVTFTTERHGKDLFVIPSDVRARVTAGTVDRSLFNVKDLAQQGFSRSTPVIVSYPGQVPPLAGARALPAVNGSAVTVDAKNAKAFWTALDPAAEVWLDRRLRVSLDRSVAQIGAPTAWQGGHDGTGVTIAVLDTGVDDTHPDLAGKVVTKRDFTDEGIEDGYGHGTHVATIIAGTGAASGGRYKGVAPGAKLLAGKVCGADGTCATSAILAGMEWAARAGARVINLSLGGEPTDGTDPLARTVDRLTLQTGALFVIASGNAGCPVCVSTPATANSALAVGAVDKSDQLATFSSRGPRKSDAAVKPEILGPGVAITAGRATGTNMGQPIDDHYTTASGTSMATPHVAGAAGLLAAAHPDWPWLRLKQALVSTARDDGYTAFEQGAGRVDVTRAFQQKVSATASLNFGTLSGGTVSKQVTYTNDGPTPLTLNLTAELRSYTGQPVSVGRLSATSVTVPARGVASVLLAISPYSAGPGVYSGLIRATSADGSTVVRTPVSYYLPTRTASITVRSLDFAGKPVAGTSLVTLCGDVPDNDPFKVEPCQGVPLTNGVAVIRVPVGKYTLFGSVVDTPNKRAAWVAISNASVNATTELVLDARKAVPSTVDDSRVTVADHQLLLSYNTPNYGWSSMLRGTDFRLYATPVLAVDGPASLVMQDHLTLRGPDAIYNLSYSQDDGIPATLTRRLDPAGLLAVHTSYHADRPNLQLTHAWWGFRTGSGGTLFQPRLTLAAPARVTEYVNRDDKVAWTRYAALGTLDKRNNYGMYHRGAFSSTEDWFAGPVAPVAPGFQRIADVFRPTSFVNDAVTGHILDVDVRDEYPIRWQMFRGGTEIAPRNTPGSNVPSFPLPAGQDTYHLRSSLVLRPTAVVVPSLAVRQHSPRVDTDWTFRSASATGRACTPTGFDYRCDFQPILQLAYDLGLDLTNQAPAGGAHTVSVTATHQASATGGAPVSKLTVSYSIDDGQTWRDAKITPAGSGRYSGVIDNPGAGTSVWLRTNAADEAGNTVSQTIQQAYTTRP